jgi:hypothetical protein
MPLYSGLWLESGFALDMLFKKDLLFLVCSIFYFFTMVSHFSPSHNLFIFFFFFFLQIWFVALGTFICFSSNTFCLHETKYYCIMSPFYLVSKHIPPFCCVPGTKNRFFLLFGISPPISMNIRPFLFLSRKALVWCAWKEHKMNRCFFCKIIKVRIYVCISRSSLR